MGVPGAQWRVGGGLWGPVLAKSVLLKLLVCRDLRRFGHWMQIFR